MNWKIFTLGFMLSIGALFAEKSPFNDQHAAKMSEAMTIEAKVKVDKPRKVLVYHKPSGFKHGSIPHINKCLDIMAKKTGVFTADFSEKVEDFSTENLKNYDLVIFNNTTKLQKEFKTAEQRKALLDYIQNGGGFMAIHAATDAGFPEWPEYVQLIGGVFHGHPWNAKGTWGISVEDPKHACCDHFPTTKFKLSDELYKYQKYDRKNQRVLMTIDTLVSPKKGRPDEDHALAWVKDYGKGKVFVSAFGHNAHLCWDKNILQLWLNGIQFAAGDLKAETAALPQPKWQLDKLEKSKK